MELGMVYRIREEFRECRAWLTPAQATRLGLEDETCRRADRRARRGGIRAGYGR
jgi:hypothetical protein